MNRIASESERQVVRIHESNFDFTVCKSKDGDFSDLFWDPPPVLCYIIF